jgi:hypothetical protein
VISHYQAHILTVPQNVFWSVDNSDIHCALSFDRMHNNQGGLIKDHFWPEIQLRLKAMGKNDQKSALGEVDELCV